MKFVIGLMLLTASVAQAEFAEQERMGTSSFHFLSRSWFPSAYSLATREPDRMDSGGRISTYNYLTFSTYLSGDYKFKLRVPFSYGTAGTDRFNGSKMNGQEFLLQDTIFEINNDQFLFMPWDIGVYFAGRVYLPVSKQSSQSGQILRYRNQMAFSKAFTQNWSFVYDQRISYYWQSRKAYRNSFEDENGFAVTDTVSLTKSWDLLHWLTLWRRVGREGGAGWAVKFEDRYWNSSAENKNKDKPAEHLMLTGPQAKIPFSDAIDFILAYEDSVNMEENANELGQFLAKNAQVTLHTFLSF